MGRTQVSGVIALGLLFSVFANGAERATSSSAVTVKPRIAVGVTTAIPNSNAVNCNCKDPNTFRCAPTESPAPASCAGRACPDGNIPGNYFPRGNYQCWAYVPRECKDLAQPPFPPNLSPVDPPQYGGTALNMTQCNQNIPNYACQTQVYDNCSNSCPGITGSALNSSHCASASSVACGGFIGDRCGNNCGYSGTGFNSGQCRSAGSVNCGDEVRDNCGNSCGYRGTNNCPAPPSPPGSPPADPSDPPPGDPPPEEGGQDPFDGSWGPFVVARFGHNDTTSNTTNMNLGLHYKNYRVSASIRGHRHGGSGADVRFRAWSSGGGDQTCSFSGSGGSLGPELGGNHGGHPMYGWRDCNINLSGSGGDINVHIYGWVKDAVVEVTWSIHGYD